MIYTIFGSIYTAFGLGVRHNRLPRPARGLGRPGQAYQAWLFGRRVESAGRHMLQGHLIRASRHH